jgi:hypothetical protein
MYGIAILLDVRCFVQVAVLVLRLEVGYVVNW